jgi:hypothetical protein
MFEIADAKARIAAYVTAKDQKPTWYRLDEAAAELVEKADRLIPDDFGIDLYDEEWEDARSALTIADLDISDAEFEHLLQGRSILLMTDCSCCGMHFIGRADSQCESCEADVHDPETTWHCTEGDACDGTACERHTPERGKGPRYVKWNPIDGTTDALRLDRGPFGEGWWVSRRHPATGDAEWLGWIKIADDGRSCTGRFFDRGDGTGLNSHEVTFYGMRMTTTIAEGTRSLAREAIVARMRAGAY